MKFSSFSLAVLATTTAAIPHRRHGHPRPARRDVDVVTATNYAVESQMAVLYVDQNGNPVSTSVEAVDVPVAAEPTSDPAVGAAGYGPPGDGWPTPGDQPSQYGPPGGWSESMPTSSLADSSSEAPSSAPPDPTEAPASYPAPSPDTSSPAPPQSSAPSDSGDGDVQDITGYSIAYAGYNGDNSCKTKDQVDADIDYIKSDNYRMVRIYGTDCDQVPNIMDAAKRNNMKVFLGIWDVNNAAAEAQLIIDGVKNDWSRVATVSVGNEVLNNGGSLSSVMNGISTARTLLQQAGYSGPVTTVEVYSKIMEAGNKDLCNIVDFIAANCHPFFNSSTTAEEAGSMVKAQADDLSDWCGGNKDVMITETGWPSAGETNGLAIPGPQNQRIALQSLRDAYVDNPNKLVLFSAYDDPWKEDWDGSFGAEKFWGIYGTAPSAR